MKYGDMGIGSMPTTLNGQQLAEMRFADQNGYGGGPRADYGIG